MEPSWHLRSVVFRPMHATELVPNDPSLWPRVYISVPARICERGTCTRCLHGRRYRKWVERRFVRIQHRWRGRCCGQHTSVWRGAERGWRRGHRWRRADGGRIDVRQHLFARLPSRHRVLLFDRWWCHSHASHFVSGATRDLWRDPKLHVSFERLWKLHTIRERRAHQDLPGAVARPRIARDRPPHWRNRRQS
jgi:hypothetical protein